MADKKLPIEVSVRGVAAYSWLYKKDDKFAKKGEDGKHKLSLVIIKDELGGLTAGLNDGKTPIGGEEWLSHLQEMHEQGGGEPQNSPVKDGDKPLDKKGKPKPKKDINEEFEGKHLVNFRTGYQPQLVDSKKNDLPDNVKIMSGDVVKVAYRPVIYEGGVTLRMNAVMLLEKRAQGGGANAFEEEDGFVADKSAADSFGSSGDDKDGDY